MKVIDVHAHYGKWFFPIEADSVEAILRMMKKNNIEKAILSSSLAIIYDFQQGNKQIASAIRDYPHLYAYLFLNPNYMRESLVEMDRYLSENSKFVGLKLYSNGYIEQPLNCAGHRKLLEVLQKKYPHSIVLFHCYTYASALELLELARDFPELNFIMGHMGGGEWRRAIGVAGEAKNIYFEICSGIIVQGKIEVSVAEVGAERIVFGSDMTLLNPAWILGMVESAEISEGEKNLILYGNAIRLFHF